MENKSGIRPVDDKVLILPDAVGEKTAGGLFLPEITKEREQMKQIKGTLVASGGNAFDDFKEGDKLLLMQGARVLFGKYAGYTEIGADGAEYRLINDRDIVAVLE